NSSLSKIRISLLQTFLLHANSATIGIDRAIAQKWLVDVQRQVRRIERIDQVEAIARVGTTVGKRKRIGAAPFFKRLSDGRIPIENSGIRLSRVARTTQRALLRRYVFDQLWRHAEDRLVHALKRSKLLLGKSHIVTRHFNVVIVLECFADCVGKR